MRSTLMRLLVAALCLDVTALVVAFALRHAKPGAGETVGAVAWFALWLDTLAVLLLAAVAVARAVRGHTPRHAIQ